MNREELKRKFILDSDGIRDSLEEVVNVALEYCAVDAEGRVYLKQHDLPGKKRVKMVLSAKAIAHELDNSMSQTITLEDLSRATGLAGNQARARAAETIEDGFAESPERGSYRANPFRVVQFLKGLAGEVTK